ncbi:MAG: Cys-tRNA(Pro) deacylase, partial [Oscillospiraceae bacterium]|nr:Cys-tRNA(Pro) deacylase [Oscillospiraceae bacterium]
GYIRGGCSPVGMKKQYPTFIDASADMFGEIYVSAGLRGQQLKVNPRELKEFIGAQFAEVTVL